jgi:exodeoxyribonuclease VII large subunit
VACAERAGQARSALAAAADRAGSRARERLDHARSRLRLLSPSALVERGHLRLDDCANRLAAALRTAAHQRRQELTDLRSRFERASPATRLPLAAQRVLALGKRLQAASPASVLNRGFVVLRDERGNPVMRRAGVTPGQRLEAEFADGSAPLRAE